MAEFRIKLDINDLEITSQAINNKGEIILKVISTKTETPCHKCGKPATIRYGYGPELTIRHLLSISTLKGPPSRTFMDQLKWSQNHIKQCVFLSKIKPIAMFIF